MKLILFITSVAALTTAAPQFEIENLQNTQNLPSEEHQLSFEFYQNEFENPQNFESHQEPFDNHLHLQPNPQPTIADNLRPEGPPENQGEDGQRFVDNRQQNFEARPHLVDSQHSAEEAQRPFSSPDDPARLENQRGLGPNQQPLVADRQTFPVGNQQPFGVPQQTIENRQQPFEVHQRQVEIHQQQPGSRPDQSNFNQVPRQVNEVSQRPIAILRDDREDLGNGEFVFSFETENGISESRRGYLGSEGQTNMEGFFSFPLPDGTFAEVRYVADENGFRAESPLIPTPHPLPAHAIEQIRIAEEQRAQGITWPDY